MFQITEEQAEGIKYIIETMYENAADKIAMADKELNKDFEYAYSSGFADEKCKQEMIKKNCAKFNGRISKGENLRDVAVWFLNLIISDYFAWYPSSSTSVSSNRYKDLNKAALTDIIERIGNICPIIERGVRIKPLFE